MNLLRAFASLRLGSAVMLLPISASAATTGMNVGDHFPELMLPSLTDGDPMSIASFRGRKLVLHVWASW